MAKVKPTGSSFADIVTAQLGTLPNLDWRPYNGGFVLSSAGVLFAVVNDAKVFLRTDVATRQRYLNWKMPEYTSVLDATLTGYFEVPACALEDPAQLHSLALEAIRATQ